MPMAGVLTFGRLSILSNERVNGKCRLEGVRNNDLTMIRIF